MSDEYPTKSSSKSEENFHMHNNNIRVVILNSVHKCSYNLMLIGSEKELFTVYFSDTVMFASLWSLT